MWRPILVKAVTKWQDLLRPCLKWILVHVSDLGLFSVCKRLYNDTDTRGFRAKKVTFQVDSQIVSWRLNLYIPVDNLICATVKIYVSLPVAKDFCLIFLFQLFIYCWWFSFLLANQNARSEVEIHVLTIDMSALTTVIAIWFPSVERFSFECQQLIASTSYTIG